MKKYLALLLSMVLALSLLTACGGGDSAESEESADKVEVGIVLPTKDESRWIQDEASFTTALENAGFTSEVKYSMGSTATELSNVEDLVERGIKVLVLCSPDAKAAGAAVQKAKEAGATVICYDRLISGTGDVDYFVTFDSYEIGKAQGQYLLEKYAGKKDVPLYLYAGNAEDENSFLLFAGAWSVLSNAVKGGQFSIQNCPAVASFAGKELDIVKNRADLEKILRTINTKWNSDEAAKLAAANLKGKKKGDVAILAPNDETARSIAATFKADKDVKSYVITGQDADLASLKAIQESRQTMTIRKDTGELADVTCNMVKKILEGGKVETTSEYDNGVKKVPAVGAGFAVVDASNLPDLISEGVFSQDEIDDAE